MRKKEKCKIFNVVDDLEGLSLLFPCFFSQKCDCFSKRTHNQFGRLTIFNGEVTFLLDVKTHTHTHTHTLPCGEGDVPTAQNLNLHEGRTSRVGWHSDDEPLLGECVEASLIVSEGFGTCAFFKWKGVSCTTVMQAHSGLTTVMSSFWMVNAMMSFFTVRIPVWNRNGLMSRSVGSGGMLPPVFSHGQE